jgi:glycosyltransferase involved in cell wall biosynthesis
MPLVSVCIPTYRNHKTIAETLQSVHNQTFKDYEIVRHEDVEGKGLADNLNNIVEQTQGKYLVFLAGDDYLLPEALQLIVNEFEKNEKVGLVTRPYYWFNGDWKVPVRKTKMIGFTTEDMIFFSGQLSGVGVRKSMLKDKFQPLTFCEFVSGVMGIVKTNDSVVLGVPTVAVRINSSESCSAWVYAQSPIDNWMKVFKENFSDNPPLLEHLSKYLSRNFIGLLQIRMYGGYGKTLREIGKMVALDPLCIYNYKFWFYFSLVQLPSPLLKKLRDLFIYRINKRLCK